MPIDFTLSQRLLKRQTERLENQQKNLVVLAFKRNKVCNRLNLKTNFVRAPEVKVSFLFKKCFKSFKIKEMP